MKFSLHLFVRSILCVMEYVHLPHSVYRCDYHIVVVTKYRKAVFNEGIFAYMEKKLAEITEHCPLVRFGMVNHLVAPGHIHVV